MIESRYSLFSDEELALLAQKGDAEAVEFLIEKYKILVRIKAQLYYIVGADRDDVVQEGMIGLYKAVVTYNGEKNSSFKTFAELCVTGQIITAIKKANREKHRPLNESVSYDQDKWEDDNPLNLEEKLTSNYFEEPEKLLMLNEVVMYIKEQREKLFSKMENKVWEQLIMGKTYTEIASALNKKPKSVDNTIQRIRHKIMAYLGGL